MTRTIPIKNLDHLQAAAREFIAATAGRSKIFAVYGSMGAGKTTFIKAVCTELGSVDTVTSPTFTLVNEYMTAGGDLIYHFDFYRIKKKEEVFDFGFEEYMASGNYCFMEWPELVEDLLPDEIVPVKIYETDNHSRMVEIEL